MADPLTITLYPSGTTDGQNPPTPIITIVDPGAAIPAPPAPGLPTYTLHANLILTGALTVGNGLTLTGTLGITGPLNVSGLATLGSLSVTGASTLTTLHATGAATFDTTLGVTGASTFSTIHVTGAATLDSTLGVTGATTVSTLHATGAVTLDSTLGVTGATTLSTLHASGTAIFDTTALVSGILSAGTGPIALTDAGGHIRSAALNTVAVGQGGTGQTTFTDGVLVTTSNVFSTVAAPVGTIVGTTDTQTLTNKTLTAPTLTSPTISGTVSGAFTFGGSPITFTGAITAASGDFTGTSDAFVLRATGFSTQTNALQIWRTSTPTTVASLFGTFAASSTAQTGLTIAPLFNAPAASTIVGALIGTGTFGSNGTTPTITEVSTLKVGPMTVGTTSASTTVTNWYGVNIPAQAALTNVTMTTATALKVTAPTGGATNYAATFMGGYTGIGTTTPSAALDVTNGYIRALDGSIAVAPTGGLGLQISSQGGTGYIQGYNWGTGLSIPVAIYGSYVYVMPTLNFGIGVATPNGKLTIANNVSAGGLDTYAKYQIIMYDGGTGGTSYGFGVEGSTVMMNSGSGAYRWYRGGSTVAMMINTSGFVGINTSNPLFQLHVEGDITVTSTYNSMAASTARYIGIPYLAGNWGAGCNVGFNMASDGSSNFLTFSTHHYGVSGGERMRLDRDGNLGIGVTPSGSFQLQVANSALVTGNLITGGTITGGSNIGTTSGLGQVYFANDPTNYYIQQSGGWLYVNGYYGTRTLSSGYGTSTYFTGRYSGASTSTIAEISSDNGGTYNALMLIGTGTSPSRLVRVYENLTVGSALSKGSGTFLIDHPLDPLNKDLYHAFVEGPRYDLLYRGTAKLKAGQAVVHIDSDCVDKAATGMTPGTFDALTQNAEVTALLNKDSFARCRASDVIKGKFTIFCEDATSTDRVNWTVMAERADKFVLHASHVTSDARGHLILEPDKAIVPQATIDAMLADHIEQVESDTPAADRVEVRDLIHPPVKGFARHPEAHGLPRLTRRHITRTVPVGTAPPTGPSAPITSQ